MNDRWMADAPCMECGARDVDATRPGLGEAFRDWLRFGGVWRPLTRTCRQCGASISQASFGALRPARRGVWWVPLRLLQALRSRRTMRPVPATYLGAAVVGAALGVAAQLLLGWSWWLVAAAFVATVALLYLSSAFWGDGASRHSLATDVLHVVSHRRAFERDHRQEVERFQAAGFPLLGLPPSWRGPRYLGGWSESWSKGGRPVTTELGLGHGDPLADRGPQLRVDVRIERIDGDQETAEPATRRRLAENLWLQAAPETDDIAQRWDQIAAGRRRPDPAWSRVTITLDGRPLDFEWLGEGRHWVAEAKLDDRTVTLHARDFSLESVELARVTDLEPYIRGKRQLDEASATPRR